jgi:hypothetical protein
MTPSSSVQSPLDADIFCPHCAYNLRGVQSANCPECGRPFDRAILASVRLPWAQRQRVGRIRAYWRTVFYALFRPFALAAEMEAGPLLRDARRFWLITVLLAWTPFVILTYVAAFNRPQVRGINIQPVILGQLVTLGSYIAFWPIFIFSVGMLVFLAAATGIPSYFCHPRHLEIERQNRAIALSYYACAVLALLAPASLLTAAVVWLLFKFDAQKDTFYVTGWIAGLFLVVVVLTWYMRTLRIVKMAAQRSRLFTTFLGVVLPFIWAALFILLGVILPAMIIYFTLFLLSSLR